MSQANPHVVPFLREAGGRRSRIDNNIVSRGLHAIETLLHIDMEHRTSVLARMRLLPKWFGQESSGLLLQQYTGHVTIAPRQQLLSQWRALSHPSEIEMAGYIRDGSRATWPLLPHIRALILVEKKLSACARRYSHVNLPASEPVAAVTAGLRHGPGARGSYSGNLAGAGGSATQMGGLVAAAAAGTGEGDDSSGVEARMPGLAGMRRPPTARVQSYAVPRGMSGGMELLLGTGDSLGQHQGGGYTGDRSPGTTGAGASADYLLGHSGGGTGPGSNSSLQSVGLATGRAGTGVVGFGTSQPRDGGGGGGTGEMLPLPQSGHAWPPSMWMGHAAAATAHGGGPAAPQAAGSPSTSSSLRPGASPRPSAIRQPVFDQTSPSRQQPPLTSASTVRAPPSPPTSPMLPAWRWPVAGPGQTRLPYRDVVLPPSSAASFQSSPVSEQPSQEHRVVSPQREASVAPPVATATPLDAQTTPVISATLPLPAVVAAAASNLPITEAAHPLLPVGRVETAVGGEAGALTPKPGSLQLPGQGSIGRALARPGQSDGRRNGRGGGNTGNEGSATSPITSAHAASGGDGDAAGPPSADHSVQSFSSRNNQASDGQDEVGTALPIGRSPLGSTSGDAQLRQRRRTVSFADQQQEQQQPQQPRAGSDGRGYGEAAEAFLLHRAHPTSTGSADDLFLRSSAHSALQSEYSPLPHSQSSSHIPLRGREWPVDAVARRGPFDTIHGGGDQRVELHLHHQHLQHAVSDEGGTGGAADDTVLATMRPPLQTDTVGALGLGLAAAGPDPMFVPRGPLTPPPGSLHSLTSAELRHLADAAVLDQHAPADDIADAAGCPSFRLDRHDELGFDSSRGRDAEDQQ